MTVQVGVRGRVFSPVVNGSLAEVVREEFDGVVAVLIDEDKDHAEDMSYLCHVAFDVPPDVDGKWHFVPGVPDEAPAELVPPAITGYRVLDTDELALINEVKAKANEVGALVEKLRCLNGIDRSGQALALDQRWISIGATELQLGFMSLVRGIAKPEGF